MIDPSALREVAKERATNGDGEVSEALMNASVYGSIFIMALLQLGVILLFVFALRAVQKQAKWAENARRLLQIFSVFFALRMVTLFMMVPIFNSMARIDRSLIEAARDGGASGWQTLFHVILPLCKPGIVIGSIFVLTIVMGDFVTVGIMGGQQIASVGKVIQVQMSYLQFPIAAANAVVLLAVVLMMIWGLTRLVDVRREL